MSGKIDTISVHGGCQRDAPHGAIIPQITTATSFVQKSLEEPGEFAYSRVKNPTRLAYETALADLEGGVYATATASGLAATTLALDLLDHGGHVVSQEGIYGGTYRLFEQVRRRTSGLTFTYLDLNDADKLIEALSEARKTRPVDATYLMVWVESPTNPLLKLVDLRKVVSAVRELEQSWAANGCEDKVLVVVDNTFATAYNQLPLKFGADVVMLSASKYIGGHSDMIGGALVVREEPIAARVAFLAKAVGAIASPFDSYMGLRGMKTLAVRLQRQSENAAAVATYLEGHPKVLETHYPGLASHPQRELCMRQMRTPGAVVTIRLKVGRHPVDDASARDAEVPPKRRRGEPDGDAMDGSRTLQRFFGALRVFVLAESLGGVESMINHSATMSHSGMTTEGRAAVGIFDETLRISCGIEAAEDLIADLARGLAAI